MTAADARAAEREQLIGTEQARAVEKHFLLQMVDMQWREHLMHLDHLRNVIGLRGYGQRDPLNEYKTEAFALFETLLADLRQSVTRWLMTVEFRFEEPPPEPAPPAAARRGACRPADRPERARARRWPRPPVASAQRQALPASSLPERWEQHQPQRPLPLRLRQEIQALPRRAGLAAEPLHQVGGEERQRVVARAHDDDAVAGPGQRKQPLAAGVAVGERLGAAAARRHAAAMSRADDAAVGRAAEIDRLGHQEHVAGAQLGGEARRRRRPSSASAGRSRAAGT